MSRRGSDIPQKEDTVCHRAGYALTLDLETSAFPAFLACPRYNRVASLGPSHSGGQPDRFYPTVLPLSGISLRIRVSRHILFTSSRCASLARVRNRNAFSHNCYHLAPLQKGELVREVTPPARAQSCFHSKPQVSGPFMLTRF